MGYRSNVAAAFYVRDAKHLPMLKLWLKEHFPMEQLGGCVRWFDRGMVFEEECVKWYDDYEDVKAFDAAANKYVQLVEDFDNAPEGSDTPVFCYEFIRVGENYEDIDATFEGYYCEQLLGVSRNITCEV